MPLPYWEVDVPIQRTDDPTVRGLHVFTGRAAGPGDALKAAHDAYDQAVLLHAAGREIPSTSGTGGWAARGLRPGWVLQWEQATATRWVDPHNLTGPLFGSTSREK
ncbi:hypothetical protein [Streptomyces sp. NPDC000229]|uniref:hypothetical protein n=1 Tax=Streptomyces sp. NPDC000229 TaxID=3154247 RepID=UPI00332EBEFC